MANLPDITTADIGIIAFWNAEDHKTAGVVDPLDCTGVFTSYDVYDNGLDGYKSLGSGRHFNCRVKNDGWCVAWIDQTNSFGYPTLEASAFGESGYKGYYDILWDWFYYNGNISSTLTTLSYIISLLEAALETSGDFTFDAADVGHYCYEFPNANVITMCDQQRYATDLYVYIQYTLGTTLYYSSISASSYIGTTSGTKQSRVRFSGNDILNYTIAGAFRYGTADILNNGWIPDPLTDYSVHFLGGLNYVDASIIVLWA